MKIFYDINTDHHDDFDPEPIVIYKDGIKTFPNPEVVERLKKEFWTPVKGEEE